MCHKIRCDRESEKIYNFFRTKQVLTKKILPTAENLNCGMSLSPTVHYYFSLLSFITPKVLNSQ
jgi:hypothetical protein